jgi:hypothetical protein
VAVIDIAHYLYYVDVLDLVLWDPQMLALLNNEAMESVQKEHKRFFVCDPAFNTKFFQQIQVHSNMNLDP